MGIVAASVTVARGIGVTVTFTNGEMLILGGLYGLAVGLRGGHDG
jgi:hypothetical protein